MPREVVEVLEVMYLSSEVEYLAFVRRVCVRVHKPLSGTRRYWRPSAGLKPFAMLVLLDGDE